MTWLTTYQKAKFNQMAQTKPLLLMVFIINNNIKLYFLSNVTKKQNKNKIKPSKLYIKIKRNLLY